MAYGIGPEINHFIVSIRVSVETDRAYFIFRRKFSLPLGTRVRSCLILFSRNFGIAKPGINFSRDGQRIGPMRVPAKVDHTYHLLSLLSWFNSNPILSAVWPLSHALVRLILRVSFSVAFRSAHVSLFTYLLYDPFVSFQYADGIRVVSIVRANPGYRISFPSFPSFLASFVFSFNQID